MLLEPAPQLQRLDALGQQLGVGPALLGIGVHRLQQRLHPAGCDGRSVQRFAAQTRAITRRHAFIGMRKELDVLRFRRTRRAAGAAEDPGGFHGREEHAFVGSVAFEHGANHFGVGRQQSGLYVHGLSIKPCGRGLHRKIDREFLRPWATVFGLPVMQPFRN